MQTKMRIAMALLALVSFAVWRQCNRTECQCEHMGGES